MTEMDAHELLKGPGEMAVAEIHPGSGVLQGNIVGIVFVDIGKQILQIPQHPGTPVVGKLLRVSPGMTALQKRPEGLDGRSDHLLVKGLLLLQLPGNGVDEIGKPGQTIRESPVPPLSPTDARTQGFWKIGPRIEVSKIIKSRELSIPWESL